MSMFNTVIFRCPECGGEILDTTKSGDCLLREYSSWHVPPEDVKGLEEELTCDHCLSEFKVIKPPVIFVELELEKI